MKWGKNVPGGKTLSVPDTHKGRITALVLCASAGSPETKWRIERSLEKRNFSPLNVLPASGWMTTTPFRLSILVSSRSVCLLEFGLLRSIVAHLPTQNSQRIQGVRSRLSGTLQTKNRNKHKYHGKNKRGIRNVSSIEGWFAAIMTLP